MNKLSSRSSMNRYSLGSAIHYHESCTSFPSYSQVSSLYPHHNVISTTTTINFLHGVWFSPVGMTSGSWYAQRKAYEDAGLWTQITDASSSLATCSQCGIGVGPDYTQNVLFLFHVVNQFAWISNGTRPFIKDDYLITCEDCARSQHRRAKKKGRPLPSAYMVLHPFLWKTKALINGTMDPLGSEPSVELLQGIQIYVQLLIDFLRCYLYKKPIPFAISQIFYQLPELLQIPQWKAYWQECSPDEQQSILQAAKPMFASADAFAQAPSQKVTSIHTTQPIPSYSQVSTTETRTPSFSRSRYTFRRPA